MYLFGYLLFIFRFREKDQGAYTRRKENSSLPWGWSCCYWLVSQTCRSIIKGMKMIGTFQDHGNSLSCPCQIKSISGQAKLMVIPVQLYASLWARPENIWKWGRLKEVHFVHDCYLMKLKRGTTGKSLSVWVPYVNSAAANFTSWFLLTYYIAIL